MRRREFITLIGGAAVTWPLAATAQKPERLRLIGMLSAIDDPELKAFGQELEKRGWSEGRNIHIEYRYAPAGAQAQTLAKELVAMQPDVIFSVSRPTTTALQKETRTIPIVFTYVIDPIGAGFIASLARPGGNLTGLMAYDPSTVGKWLGMHKELAPYYSHTGRRRYSSLRLRSRATMAGWSASWRLEIEDHRVFGHRHDGHERLVSIPRKNCSESLIYIK